MSVAVMLTLAVVTAGGEAWAKNWNLSEEEKAQQGSQELMISGYAILLLTKLLARGGLHRSLAMKFWKPNDGLGLRC